MAAFCELEASYSPFSTEKMFSCNQEISGFLSTKLQYIARIQRTLLIIV